MREGERGGGGVKARRERGAKGRKIEREIGEEGIDR